MWLEGQGWKSQPIRKVKVLNIYGSSNSTKIQETKPDRNEEKNRQFSSNGWETALCHF